MQQNLLFLLKFFKNLNFVDTKIMEKIKTLNYDDSQNKEKTIETSDMNIKHDKILWGGDKQDKYVEAEVTRLIFPNADKIQTDKEASRFEGIAENIKVEVRSDAFGIRGEVTCECGQKCSAKHTQGSDFFYPILKAECKCGKKYVIECDYTANRPK